MRLWVFVAIVFNICLGCRCIRCSTKLRSTDCAWQAQAVAIVGVIEHEACSMVSFDTACSLHFSLEAKQPRGQIGNNLCRTYKANVLLRPWVVTTR
jgi:hypothetical protein